MRGIDCLIALVDCAAADLDRDAADLDGDTIFPLRDWGSQSCECGRDFATVTAGWKPARL